MVISSQMLLSAAKALAEVVTDDQLNASYIVPSVFDSAVHKAVAGAVAEAARATAAVVAGPANPNA
jgi:malate dehydrogenase (oxaloacetate-decarboxylating)